MGLREPRDLLASGRPGLGVPARSPPCFGREGDSGQARAARLSLPIGAPSLQPVDVLAWAHGNREIVFFNS